MTEVTIVGLGKAGLPLAAVMAESGIKVNGLDINASVVAKINAGENPVKEEAGLSELIKKHGGKSLVATSDAKQAMRSSTAHIVLVPMVVDEKGTPDFGNILSAAKSISSGLKRGDLVVLETTVPVGTINGIFRKTIEDGSGLKAGADFMLAHSPERIMTGYSISRFKEFPKVVGGMDDKSTQAAANLYSRFCDKVVAVSSVEAAEMTKIAEGVYRDANIAIANSLYLACQDYGIDFWEVRMAANHYFCNILEAGAGVGGHCIPVYPQFLIRDFEKRGKPLSLLESAREVNDGMATYFSSLVSSELSKRGTPKGKVAVAGLTFREGVKELFYARSKPLVAQLKAGGFSVSATDPILSREEVEKEFGVPYFDGSSFEGFDAIVVVNKEPRYLPALEKVRDKAFIVDCKNIMGGNLEESGKVQKSGKVK